MSPVSVATSQSKYALKTGSAKLWILLVGVNKYQDSSFPPLQYSALDCQGLSEALADATQAFPQKEIIIYHDFAAQSPTLKTILQSLTQISQAANSQDTVLFYFSGHGLLEPQSQQAFLCFQDTQKDDIINTGLSLAELLDMLGNCSAHQQLVWLDACHSGRMILKGFRGEIETPKNNTSSLLNPTSQLVDLLRKRAAQSKGFYALLSCDRAQQSWEFPQLGHGVFTYYLMRGLRGEAADSQGVIDVDGLYKYVYHQTLQHIDKTNQQLRLINQQKRHRGEVQLLSEYPLQTPKRIVEGVGELILGLKPDTIALQHSRLALIIEGLSCNENCISLCKALRQEGNFEVDYWPKPGKAFSEIREAIQLCLKSHSLTPSQLQAELPPTISKTPDTALLYLRGRIAQTEEGEAWLILGDDLKISRSWLRQELRRSRITQQIIILDCPGATSLAEWVEDLQLSPEQGQCLIAAAATLEEPEKFAQALLETLKAADKQIGLPAAGWISRLQMYLAGTDITLHVWLSGTQGIIEILPGGWRRIESAAGLDLNLCPYMGLQAFGEEDAQFFHGRETLTQQLVNKLNSSAFLAVIGASGSGKSSVVHAGLVSQLKQGKQLPGSEQWWIKSVRPSANPLQALSWRMVDAGTEREKAYQQMELEGILYEGVEGFVRWLRSRPEPMVILIVDQFEEVFTLAAASDRKRFLDIILGALDYASDRFKLVVVLRADFISSCLEVPALTKALQQSSVLVPPYLTREDYRQAIVMPAEKVGLHIEPQLVEVLLEELNYSAGDLPLLQFVLEQLWLHRDQGKGKITLEVYQQKIGGLKGALERKAQAVFDNLDQDEQECAKWIFLALTQLGEGKEDTRRRVFKSDLIVKKYSSDLVERTLQALTTAKLIVMNCQSDENVVGRSRDGEETPLDSQEDSLQEVTVEVAHEALIRHWSTLRWWLEENRARLRVQRQLVHSAMLWKQNHRHSDFLLQGVRLAEAEDIYIKYTDELSEDVQLFIDACLEGRKQQQFQLKKRLRQAQIAVATISVLALGALGLGSLAYLKSRTAQLREIEALNSLSENYLLSNKQLEALVTSVKAARQLKKMMWFGNVIPPKVSEDIQNQTASNLQEILPQIREYNRLQQHNDEIFSVAFSPDGQTIASGSQDKTVKLWKSDGQLVRILKGHHDRVTGVSFSSDGKLVASGSSDKTIKIWRTSDGQLLRTLTGHTSTVNSLSFSSDGQTIASGSEDKTIKLWRAKDGQLLRTLKGHLGQVNRVSFNPDSKLIASAGEDKTIRLWRTNDGQLLKTIKAHTDQVWRVSFSPDSKLIVSASGDKTVKLWRVGDGSLVRSLTGHNDEVNSASFSPDGRIIASGSRDGIIKIWRTSNGSLLDTLSGHTGEIESVNFNPDGQTIASASRDGTIRLWRVTNQAFPNVLLGHKGGVNGVSFSPDGQLLASVSTDKTIKLWKVSNRSLLKTLLGHTEDVYKLSFSPDSQILASAGWDKTIKLWKVSDGALLKTLQGHTDKVFSVSFSPDGKVLASASWDKTIKLWRVKDGSLLNTLRGHNDSIEKVAFSPDGQIIASASRDGTIKLWSRRDGKLVKTIKANSGKVFSVSFSPDGQIIASSQQDKTIKLWRRNGTLIRTLQGHKNYVWDVIFSPNGQLIASASEDKTVKLWQTSNGQLLRTFEGHKAVVTNVSFSPNSQMIASGSSDGTIRLWRLDGTELKTLKLNSLIAPACNWLHDYLKTNPTVSKQERQLCSDSILLG